MHEPRASVSDISRVFSKVRSVLSQCNTWLRLLRLLYDIEVMWRKTIKHAPYVLLSHKTWLFNKSELTQSPCKLIRVIFLVFTHVIRRPCWCTKQWQNVAQVLHNNNIYFFSLLSCTPTWLPWRHVKTENNLVPRVSLERGRERGWTENTRLALKYYILT